MGWNYSHDRPWFDAAARLHQDLDLWWVLWSAPRRRFYGFWCGPQLQEPVHAPDEAAFLVQIAEVEREHLGLVVSVPALATPTERLLERCRAAGVTVQDQEPGLRLTYADRTVLVALRPDTTGPKVRWWVSWTSPGGAHARPVADPGQEDHALTHILRILTDTDAPAPIAL